MTCRSDDTTKGVAGSRLFAQEAGQLQEGARVRYKWLAGQAAVMGTVKELAAVTGGAAAERGA